MGMGHGDRFRVPANRIKPIPIKQPKEFFQIMPVPRSINLIKKARAKMPAQIFFQKTLFLPSNSSKIDRLPRPTLQTAVGTRGQVRHPALQTAEACNTECLVISIA